jgi:hypothetical protein
VRAIILAVRGAAQISQINLFAVMIFLSNFALQIANYNSREIVRRAQISRLGARTI